MQDKIHKIVDVTYEVEVPAIVHAWLSQATTDLTGRDPGVDVYLKASSSWSTDSYRGVVQFRTRQVPFQFDWTTIAGQDAWTLKVEITPYDYVLYRWDGGHWHLMVEDSGWSPTYSVACATVRNVIQVGWVIEALTGSEDHRINYLAHVHDAMLEITDKSLWV